jgi:hypothetical protein
MTSKNTAQAAFGTMHSKASVIAGVIMLLASGAAQAKDNDNNECSNATLNALYAFHASGFNIVGGVPQPKAIVELIQFNGDGTLTGPGATVSVNGGVFRSPPSAPGAAGTYAVTPACIGSLAFAAGQTFDFYIGFRESELYMIQTNTNTVFQGTAERLSR